MPIASTTEIAQTALTTMAGGVYTVLGWAIPAAIGMMVLFFGLRWAKKAIHGKV